jgi:hypothetical protein
MSARTIDVEPDSDLAQLLRLAQDQPIVLKLDGEQFQLRRETAGNDSDNRRYDALRVIQGMEDARGAITPAEAEEWIQNIYRWRREGSRPINEP